MDNEIMSKDKQYESPFKCICVYGQYGVGKTLFALNSPFKPIVVLDNENGARIYRDQFEFDWRDCTDSKVMAETVLSITKGDEQYGTIVIDTISQYEDWAKDSVWSSAQEWEKTKQTGILWGKTKDILRKRILGLTAKAQVVILTAHSRMEWVGNRPTGKLEAKAMEPVWNSSDVVAFLTRRKGERIPDGDVVPPYGKSRILALPEHITPFTWAKILSYINEKPADWDNLSPEEQAKDAYEVLDKLSKIEEANPE